MAFSLKVAGVVHVLRRPAANAPDVVLLALHILLWVVLPAHWLGFGAALVNYLLITWVEGVYLCVVFVPNHLGGLTDEEARDWPRALRQIVTSRNLPASRLFNHLWVGLNSHIEHHIFSHLPATRLAAARGTTRRMCASHGIPYRECSLRRAFAEVHAYNRRMAEIARVTRRQRPGRPAGDPWHGGSR